LKEEIEYFNSMLEEWLQHYEGQYALIGSSGIPVDTPYVSLPCLPPKGVYPYPHFLLTEYRV